MIERIEIWTSSAFTHELRLADEVGAPLDLTGAAIVSCAVHSRGVDVLQHSVAGASVMSEVPRDTFAAGAAEIQVEVTRGDDVQVFVEYFLVRQSAKVA